jgi:hypothetical protein
MLVKEYSLATQSAVQLSDFLLMNLLSSHTTKNLQLNSDRYFEVYNLPAIHF